MSLPHSLARSLARTHVWLLIIINIIVRSFDKLSSANANLWFVFIVCCCLNVIIPITVKIGEASKTLEQNAACIARASPCDRGIAGTN